MIPLIRFNIKHGVYGLIFASAIFFTATWLKIIGLVLSIVLMCELKEKDKGENII